MIDWNEFTPIKSYDNDWQKDWPGQGRPLLQNLVDDIFYGVNDLLNGSQYRTLDQEREQMLEEDPSLNIRNLNDGYDLEADRLNAIAQKNSKGLQVFDINPGLLTVLDNPLTLPYEFLFDGTGFMVSPNGSITQNFRTVNVPLAGNFLKIEFIYENNQLSNLPPVSGLAVPSTLLPRTQTKYSSALATSPFGEINLTTGQTVSSFDQYARNKVWVDFGPNTGKPHIVPTSGRVFKTYFSEVNISVNIGCPKIRITVGTNSEVYNDSNVSAINSKLALTGSGRLLADSDTTLAPFCINEADFVGNNTFLPNGISLAANVANQTISTAIVSNLGYYNESASAAISLGYSVLWITRIYFEAYSSGVTGHIAVYLTLDNNVFTTTDNLRVHNFKLTMQSVAPDVGIARYVLEPSEPIRVTIPSGNNLIMSMTYNATAPAAIIVSYAIDGYAYGNLVRKYSSDLLTYTIQTSKFITDATFLSDYNRIDALKDAP